MVYLTSLFLTRFLIVLMTYNIVLEFSIRSELYEIENVSYYCLCVTGIKGAKTYELLS